VNRIQFHILFHILSFDHPNVIKYFIFFLDEPTENGNSYFLYWEVRKLNALMHGADLETDPKERKTTKG
jgi:hypothetical protein